MSVMNMLTLSVVLWLAGIGNTGPTLCGSAYHKPGHLGPGLENGFEKNLGFLGFLKKLNSPKFFFCQILYK